MKLVEKPCTVKSRGIQSTVKFGIKADGIAHIFHVLRNQLYSDKVTAVIREYSTNAADAHVETGKVKPIEITLPSRFEPTFKVRDFGPSLSEDEIKDIFAYYGESTKRNTNNQTGMLGIGSKSAFAYGDNFVINAYLGGEKHTYNAFIDDTKVGQISKLSCEKSDEERGLEIVVPVGVNDVDEFKEKAKECFRHFVIKPIVNGKQIEYDESVVLYSGKGWSWLKNAEEKRGYGYGSNRHGEPIAIMGNIGYPIDTEQLKLGDDAAISNFACANLRLEFPIGDLEIAASRESLQYSDYTINSINKKLKESAKELLSQIEKDFTKCESKWQAKVILHELFDYGGSLHSASTLIKKDLEWNGQKVEGTTISLDPERNKEFKGLAVEFHTYVKGYRGKQKVKGECAYRIEARQDVLVILNDNAHRRGVLAHVVSQVEKEGKHPFLITLKDPNHKAKVLKALGMVESDAVLLSSLPKLKLDVYTYGSTSGSGKNSKHTEKVFSFNGKGNWSQQSTWWDSAEVDLDAEKEVVYVTLDRFCWEDSLICDYSRRSNYLANEMESIEKFGFAKGLTVYGVKTKAAEKFAKHPNTIGLGEYLQREVKKEIETRNLGKTIASINAYEQIENCWKALAKHPKGFRQDGVIALLLKEVQRVEKLVESEKKTVETLKNAAEKLKVELAKDKPEVDMESLVETIKETYPMMHPVIENTMGYSYRYSDNKDRAGAVKMIEDYVRLVESNL